MDNVGSLTLLDLPEGFVVWLDRVLVRRARRRRQEHLEARTCTVEHSSTDVESRWARALDLLLKAAGAD